MATTAVFAEIVVIGLQIEAWIALLVLTIFGVDWIQFGLLDEWVSLITIVAVASAYVLGVVGDRLADSLVAKLAHGEDPSFREERLRVMYARKEWGTFLEYQRSRLRVARGTSVNAAITAVMSVAYSVSAGASEWVVATVFILAAVVAVASWRSADLIRGAHEKWIKAAKRLLEEESAVGRRDATA